MTCFLFLLSFLVVKQMSDLPPSAPLGSCTRHKGNPPDTASLVPVPVFKRVPLDPFPPVSKELPPDNCVLTHILVLCQFCSVGRDIQ